MSVPRRESCNVTATSTMGVDIGKVTLVVITYWTISIAMVFANKYLVGSNTTADISLFITWLQCIVTILITIVIYAVKNFRSGAPLNLGAIFPERSMILSREVLLMSGCFISMLSFNNMCLHLVGVSFYQIARSTTIIFVVIFSVIILKKSVSKAVIGCCCLVAVGFFLGIDQEKVLGSLSIKGAVFGVISSVFIALTGIFTKQALEVVNKDELRLTMCSNSVAVIGFIPVIFLTGHLRDALAGTQIYDSYFWILILFSGSVGLLLSWISAVQINVTSPLTHNVSTNTKAILQTILAVLYYAETKSLLWWVSVLMVVFGACFYAVVRIKEEQAAKPVQTTIEAPEVVVEKTGQHSQQK